jgi:hypothetical protein
MYCFRLDQRLLNEHTMSMTRRIKTVGLVAVCLATVTCGRGDSVITPTPVLADPSIVLPAQDPTGFIGPKGIYPDPQRTPGAVNPDIRQANIALNLCNPNWSTDSIRPPSTYTTALKIKQMAAWGLPGTTADYEEDHLISLELGGNPTSEWNLWPESYEPTPGARQKDTVENRLHREVCAGVVTLRQAQDIVRGDWYACYLTINQGGDCR